jgi:protein-disulfide isomerase
MLKKTLLGIAALVFLGMVGIKGYGWWLYTDTLKQSAEAPGGIEIGTPGPTSLTIVEFVDYQCHFCPIMNSSLMTAIGGMDDVRVVVRPLPWLNPDSADTATFMTALLEQNATEAEKLHTALMNREEPASFQQALAVARDLGIETDEAVAMRKSPEIISRVQQNLVYAQSLRLQTIPALIIGSHIYAPATEADIPTAEQLRTLIDQQRKN